MTERKIVYIDLDGVLANYDKKAKYYMEKLKMERDMLHTLPNFYLDLEPIEGALEAYHKLHSYYNVYILSTPSWSNASSYSDKNLWVRKYLGDVAYKKLILSHNKSLLLGQYLIDDRTANGAGNFTGTHIHFGSDDFPNWDIVLDYLLPKDNPKHLF